MEADENSKMDVMEQDNHEELCEVHDQQVMEVEARGAEQDRELCNEIEQQQDRELSGEIEQQHDRDIEIEQSLLSAETEQQEQEQEQEQEQPLTETEKQVLTRNDRIK